ncbi:protein L-Myc-1b-like [Hippocampus zosterae]|uniref:protein L-Myc-1b-like n=1 Tax=Hippocampus zosterae TaxID=109293 RepID=UPI00223C8FBC|nr:protein L-Myc-1b-like [Hippocampus zosterae]
MLGISSSTAPRYDSWDMDHLDYYQHYFYDDHHNPEEDFFKATAPSEDIWKKFELVPTPPMSPIRTVEGLGRFGLVCPTLGDKLEWVSQFLGQEDEQQQQQQDPPCKVTPATDSVGNLSSIIIQDCMWSGFSTGWQLERMVGERCHPCQAKGGPATTKVVNGTSPGRAQGVHTDALPLGCLVADCVDPAAVLTFPFGGCKKQISSGSESRTNSSDDEDDQDEDEEEIDVVTVEHKQQRKPRRLVNGRKPATITVPVDPLDPGMKRFHISIHQQQHNYAAPSPDTLPPSSAELQPRKRIRHEASAPAHHQPSQHYHQPRLGHAPSKFDCRRSHAIVAGARSESPDLGALSPSSPASPSSAELPPRKRIRHEASAPAHHQPSQHYHQPRLGHAPSKFDCKRSHAIVAGARSESPELGALSPTSPASPSSPHCSSSSSSSSSSSPPPPLSSPQSSDCEDTDRRKTHNYLERKRRNDLRSRFLLLRDEIPGLADCAKTSKATILTRATEYLRQLHACERQQAHERKQLKAKQAQLLQRLAQLRRS